MYMTTPSSMHNKMSIPVKYSSKQGSIDMATIITTTPRSQVFIILTVSLLLCIPMISASEVGIMATATVIKISDNQQTTASPQVGLIQSARRAHSKRHSGPSEDFPPKIIHQPQSVLMKPNEPHTIECAIESQPPAEVKWFKDDQPLASQPGKLEQMDKELMFIQVSDEDTGDYHCQAENYLGSITSDHFRLTVQSSVHEPRIRFEPRVAEVGVDQQVEFTCTIPVTTTTAATANNREQRTQQQAPSRLPGGRQPPEVSWKRNGRRLLVKWLEFGEDPAGARSRFVARQSANGDYVLTVTRTQLKDDNATFTCLYRQQQQQQKQRQEDDDDDATATNDSPQEDNNNELARESSPVKMRVYEHWIPPSTPPVLDNHVKLDVDLAPPIDNLESAGNSVNELNQHSKYHHHHHNNHTTQLHEPRRISSLGETLFDLYEIAKPALVIIGLISLVMMFVILQLVIIRRRNRQNRYMKHHPYSSGGSGSSNASSAIGAGSIDCDPVLSSLMARTLSAPSASSLSGASKKFRSYRDHMRKVAAAGGDLVAGSDLVDAAGQQHYFGQQQQPQQQQFAAALASEQEPAFFASAIGCQASLYNQSLAAREQARSLLQASDHMRSLSNLNSCHKQQQQQQQQQCLGQGLRLSQNGSHLNLPLSFAFGGSRQVDNRQPPSSLIGGPSQLMANALWQPHLAAQMAANTNRNSQHNQKKHQPPAAVAATSSQQQQQDQEHYQLVNCSSISPSSTSSMVGGSSSNSSGQQHHVKDSQNHYSIIETNDEEDRYEEVDHHQGQQGAALNGRSRCNLHIGASSLPPGPQSPNQPQQDNFGALQTSTFVTDHHQHHHHQHHNHSSQNNSNISNSNNNSSNNHEGLNQKSSLRSSLISNSSTSGYGESSTNTSGSLVSDAFSRFGSKRSSSHQDKQQTKSIARLMDSKQPRQQGYQDQLSPYAVSSICGSVAPLPPPMNSEAMRALNEQFDINHLMMLDESTMSQQLPFNAPPPPPLPQSDGPKSMMINNNDDNHKNQTSD